MYRITKSIDPTRPCIDSSGGFHAFTDIYDIHDYEQFPEKLAEHMASLRDTGKPYDKFSEHQDYDGQAVFISEFGGFCRADDLSAAGWGYGEAPKCSEEFIERYRELTRVLMDTPNLLGFCYTQLYDIEQEINGLYTYDRKPKLDPEIFKEINRKKAKIEE